MPKKSCPIYLMSIEYNIKIGQGFLDPQYVTLSMNPCSDTYLADVGYKSIANVINIEVQPCYLPSEYFPETNVAPWYLY